MNAIEENYKHAYDDFIWVVELREILGKEYSQWNTALKEICY
ncbi:hypothetical protein [Terrisporobacter petrolearius]